MTEKMIRRIKKEVTHQNIGGNDFKIEFELSLDELYKKVDNGNLACRNFLNRRNIDNISMFNYRLYYGKVGNLGYVVCEDEFEDFNTSEDLLTKIHDELVIANKLKERELKQQMFFIELFEEIVPIDDGKKKMLHGREMRGF